MDYTTIILATVAGCAVISLAYMAGYELGTAAGTEAERELANRRINGVLESINKTKPRARKRRAAK